MLADNLQSKNTSKFSNIPSFAYRNENRSISYNKRSEYIGDLDSLPEPAWDMINISDYYADHATWYNPKKLNFNACIPILTSRSCPFSCNFCACYATMGRKFRKRSPKKVVDEIQMLCYCPECSTHLGEPIKRYKRYIEDIPSVQPEVTEHTVYGYWCSTCKKVVYAKVADALPNAMLGLRLVVFTAWLHYLIGISVNNIVKMLCIFANFKVSPGGLTQAWKNLAFTLESIYNDIGKKVSNAAVLNADETGWRINGITHWLWCFASRKLCYYVIDRSRSSPVLKEVFGTIFNGILICDFWGAYNKLSSP